MTAADTRGLPESKVSGMGQWDCSSIHAQAIHNFKHPSSRFIVTIVHPQRDVPVGRAVDTVKKIRPELK